MDSIAFTGGGTGGHIFPGLAVIEELRARSPVSLYWIGSSRGVDRSLVEASGVQFYGIPSGKLRRYASLENVIDLFRVVAGIFASLILLIRHRPRLLFSKGGFVSVPPCLAARLLRIPIITHECDFSPGLATRINSRFARWVFVSYAETIDRLPPHARARAIVTGNPVRAAFYSAQAERGRAFLGFPEKGLPILLVQGGSLGARQINEIVSSTLPSLLTHFRVVHQTGKDWVDASAGVAPRDTTGEPPVDADSYRAFPFIGAQMSDVLACADVVVSRAGANSVWECATMGKPMILIPLEKGASRGDQVENAAYFASRGAAIVLSGEEASAQGLLIAVTSLASDPALARLMSEKAASIARDRPSAGVAEKLLRAFAGEDL